MMLRVIIVVAALLAPEPSTAEQLSVAAARHFVVGKLFAFNCFEGTRGLGRIYGDGSVTGRVQFGGSGPVRYVVLPAGTVRVQNEAVCASVYHTMALTGGCHGDLTFSQISLFVSDLKQPSATDHVVNLVRTVMGMRSLHLARLETIEVAEESFGFENPILFHFLLRELGRIRKFLEHTDTLFPSLIAPYPVILP